MTEAEAAERGMALSLPENAPQCSCGPRLYKGRVWKKHVYNADYSQCADCDGWISGRDMFRMNDAATAIAT